MIAYRKLLVAVLLLAIMVSGFAFVRGAAAADYGCVAFAADLRNDTGSPQTATVFFADWFTDAALTNTASLTLLPGQTGTLRLVAFVPLPVYAGGGPGGLTVLGINPFGDVISVDNCIGGSIGDGRINDGADQLAAPVAVYCQSGLVHIYKIDPETGAGELALSVEQVSSMPTDGTTLLGADMGIEIYWRPDGKYQVNTVNFEGNLYAIAWRGCSKTDFEYIAPQPGF